MNTLLTDKQLLVTPTLDNVYNDVKAVLPPPPPDTGLLSMVYDMLQVLLAVLPFGEATEGIIKVVGVVASLVGAGNDITNAVGGEPEDQLQTKVDQLSQQAGADFAASLVLFASSDRSCS